MRVLVAPIPASSHVFSAAPLAWALQNAGHEVRVAGQPSAAATIAGCGLVAAPVGRDVDLASTLARPPGFADDVLRSLDLDDAEPTVRDSLRNLVLPGFADFVSVEQGLPVAEAFLELIHRWRPDLVVWDSGMFPAGVAAHAAGVRHMRLLWGRDWIGMLRGRLHGVDDGRPDVLATQVAPLLERLGCRFDEQVLIGQASIDPNPEEMRWPTGLDYLPVRWTPYTGPGVVPDWVSEPAPRDRVCLSLGVSYREFMDDSDIPIVEILRGLAGLGPEVVATVDERQVPASVTLPDTVRLVDYVPLSALLGTCSAVVHHGGTGTWGAALAHAVPQVIVARTQIDYPAFGAHTEAAGAGVHVPVTGDPGATADAVVSAVARVLTDPTYTARAAELLERTNRAPSLAALVDRVEELVARWATSSSSRATSAAGLGTDRQSVRRSAAPLRNAGSNTTASSRPRMSDSDSSR